MRKPRSAPISKARRAVLSARFRADGERGDGRAGERIAYDERLLDGVLVERFMRKTSPSSAIHSPEAAISITDSESGTCLTHTSISSIGIRGNRAAPDRPSPLDLEDVSAPSR